jgi:predicted nucleic acid-binding protein
MILYADSSALVKRYLTEAGSAEVDTLIEGALQVGTALITRAEVAAALSKAVRVGALKEIEARNSLQEFRTHWTALTVIQITETLITTADYLAWEHGLRGYDAVHLAAAFTWQEALGESVTVATYDKQLWQAVKSTSLLGWPESLS